jgi:ubiquinone biosynthesis protein UbiJ
MLIDLLNRPANFWLARGVARSTTATALCERLNGKRMQIAPTNAALATYFEVIDGQLAMHAGLADAADATLSGTPINLARLSAGDPQAVIRAGDVRVTGDEDVASDFQALLQVVRPDWEEELSQVVGDVPAHEVGRFAAGAASWLGGAGKSLARSLGEFVSEETRSVATQTEIDEFCAAVDEVSVGVERLEARLAHLRASRDAS